MKIILTERIVQLKEVDELLTTRDFVEVQVHYTKEAHRSLSEI